jgi:hypothetical protein
VLSVLRSFASEFRERGLLFMKNIERLEFGGEGLAIEIAMAGDEAIRS